MNKKKSSTISIIIRTKNEEKWIGHCLNAIFEQKVNHEIEVIIVDNASSDGTINIAKRYPIKKIININKFLPGKALNKGIRNSSGDFIVCISAHCIPVNSDWLRYLVDQFSDNHKIAGVYGRQLPLSFTDPIDKRDMLIVFGLDKKIQKKDYFFHNANSMIPRSVWEKYPFDENVTNIEDRVWGKKVIESDYKIIYEPKAAVYHHHGLHQGNAPERAKGVVSILEHVDAETINDLPKSMTPDKINVTALIPVIGKLSKKTEEFKCLSKTVNNLKKSKYINSIYCLSDQNYFSDTTNIKWINRNLIKNADELSLNKILKFSLSLIEKNGDFPDNILYVNHDYLNRPSNIFDQLIYDAQYKGFDTVFPGLVDYGHYWFQDNDDHYKQTDPSLKSRDKRDPLYKALYGLGCLTATWVIRSGQMVDGKVGILAIQNDIYSNRLKK